jgi:hypothetical protein
VSGDLSLSDNLLEGSRGPLQVRSRLFDSHPLVSLLF